jgi:endonuclease/exonuclease/phosphatase family metal-dependent hydrolase
MASCGVPHYEIKDGCSDQKTRITPRVSLEKLTFGNGIVLKVRVLEAVGLYRETHSHLKRVVIRDPFCTLQLRGVTEDSTSKKTRKTKTKKSTLFPMWDETFSFDIHEDDLNHKSSVIRLEVHGYERIGSSHLGIVNIGLNDIGKNCQISEDESFQNWFQLEKQLHGKTTMLAGKIFLAFKILQYNKQKNGMVPPIRDVDTKEEDIGIYIGTMNCGNAAPPNNLGDWLRPNVNRHKIVVVGCQECEWKMERHAEKIWNDAILASINEIGLGNNKYRTLLTHSLEEMRIFCFVDEDSVMNHKISHLSSWHEAAGIAHVYGNKGGTVIAFDYGGTSLCFINAHLAAHQSEEHWKHRNSDYQEISSISTGCGNGKHDILEKFHHVFWMGDLNYRCNYKQMEDAKNTPSTELFNEYTSKIAQGDFTDMLKYDQLNISRDKGDAFFGFREGKITFQPTFKVFVGKNYQYQPKRSPSWCDRILWKSAMGFERHVKCIKYANSPKVQSSDHKPVWGEFSILTWPRAPGIVDVGETRWKMKGTILFRSCKATGLRQADMGGASDPFLHFPRQELLEVHQKSNRVRQDNDPKWRDDDLPCLKLHRTNPRFLSNSLLLVQCRDYDRFSSADKLASGCLPLKPLVENPDKWIKFKQNLTHKGLAAGVLEGEFRLELSY